LQYKIPESFYREPLSDRSVKKDAKKDKKKKEKEKEKEKEKDVHSRGSNNVGAVNDKRKTSSVEEVRKSKSKIEENPRNSKA
jgi:hypothetical protein